MGRIGKTINKYKIMIGEKISPILVEIEETLWEFEYYNGTKPNYTIEGLRASIKIFMSTMMDKIWELQEEEKIDPEDRVKMVEKLGNDVRNIVKTYVNIDTHDLYK
jgi:hypothetical protein